MADSPLTQPPLSLYIHFPWCVRKCPYCDFNSHETREIPEQAYIRALLTDFDQDKSWWEQRSLHSIFMGGGTPSLFSASAMTQLLEALQQRIRFADNLEITLEANPGTFEQARFRGYRAAGINRLSLGVQSFDDQQLQTLGRIHSSHDARHAIESALEAGFDNINIDLMHGLPQQTPAQALSDLQQAIDLQPTHLSWYQLTIEPNTVFYSKPPALPEDDTLWSIQEQGQQLLAEQGYQQYEISAYSRPGKQCQHNLNYWQFGDYLALGAGAHGKITCPDTGQIIRYQKTRLPQHYLDPEKSFTAQQAPIPPADLPFEFFMNGFRLNQGVSKQDFEKRTGIPFRQTRAFIDKAKALGLIEETATRCVPTDKGRLYLNDLLQLFLP
ncbi:MAG: radical SAM family heme chaperone HemW [Ketobacteraceae bacterium]|nr:radical SAM family heme chaperone HemW [Ketobacteraceae bacterium]